MQFIHALLLPVAITAGGVAAILTAARLVRRRNDSYESPPPVTVIYVPDGFELFEHFDPPAATPQWVAADSAVRRIDLQGEPPTLSDDEIDRRVDMLVRDPVRLTRLLEDILAYEAGPDDTTAEHETHTDRDPNCAACDLEAFGNDERNYRND